MSDSLVRLAWRTVRAVIAGDDAAATQAGMAFGSRLQADIDADRQRELERRAEEALREHIRIHGSWFPRDTNGLPPPIRRRRGWGWRR